MLTEKKSKVRKLCCLLIILAVAAVSTVSGTSAAAADDRLQETAEDSSKEADRQTQTDDSAAVRDNETADTETEEDLSGSEDGDAILSEDGPEEEYVPEAEDDGDSLSEAGNEEGPIPGPAPEEDPSAGTGNEEDPMTESDPGEDPHTETEPKEDPAAEAEPEEDPAAGPSADAPEEDKELSAEEEEAKDASSGKQYRLARMVLADKTFTYTGNAVTPQGISVYGETSDDNGSEEVLLAENRDYTLSFADNINAGKASVTVEGKGEYAGMTLTGSFTISRAKITSAEVQYKVLPYTGLPKTQTKNTVVKCGDRVLTKTVDYKITYENNIEPGTATMTVTGRGNYKGTLIRHFKIKYRITSAELKHSVLPYTGLPKTQTGTTVVKALIKGKEIVLTKGTDYKITYRNNTEPGTAVMKITGVGEYTGTIWKHFRIKYKITSAELKHSSLPYTGLPKTQTGTTVVKAEINGKEVVLTKGTDYKITYENNVNAGKAKMVITGRGSYTGTIRKSFRITAVPIKSAVLAYTSKLYTGKELKPGVTVSATVNKETVVLKKGTDYTVSYSDNIRIGTATVIITGKGNYKGSVTKKFSINRVMVTGSGTTRTLHIAPTREFKELKAAVWTERNYQNDITWYTMKQGSSGNWTARIRLSNLLYDGKCIVHLYDGGTCVSASDFSVPREDWLQARSEDFRANWLYGSDSDVDFLQCAINIARNDAIGYGHTWPTTISCAGLVGLTLTYCGYGDFIKSDPLEWRYLDLGTYSGEGYDWCEIMRNEVGATWHAGTGGLQKGDILYYDYGCYSNHVAFYIGDGSTVEARADNDGSDADGYGNEVSVCWNWQTLPWQGYWRLPEIHYRNAG